jgi:hypothetical protein
MITGGHGLGRAAPAHGLRVRITMLRPASAYTLEGVAAYMAKTFFPRTLMRGSLGGTVEPDRHRQETLDLVALQPEAVAQPTGQSSLLFLKEQIKDIIICSELVDR